MGGCSTEAWAVWWKCWPTRLIDLPAFVVAWCVHPFLIAASVQCLASAFVCGLEAASSRVGVVGGLAGSLKQSFSKTLQEVVLWYRPHHQE